MVERDGLCALDGRGVAPLAQCSGCVVHDDQDNNVKIVQGGVVSMARTMQCVVL